MKFKKSNTDKSEIKVVVSFEDKEIQSYTQYAAKELGKTVDIKGFRKGHIPVDIIEEKYGKDMLLEFAMEKMKSFYFCLKKFHLQYELVQLK